MVTPRLLLLYNFGLAVLFVVLGFVSLAVLEPVFTRQVAIPPFDRSSLEAIRSEPDIEKLRTRATYYFELGRDLKQARYSDTGSVMADLRKFCFALGLVFGIGGVLTFAVLRRRSS
jgi:hypothetical protein